MIDKSHIWSIINQHDCVVKHDFDYDDGMTVVMFNDSTVMKVIGALYDYICEGKLKMHVDAKPATTTITIEEIDA